MMPPRIARQATQDAPATTQGNVLLGWLAAVGDCSNAHASAALRSRAV
jgi:hypothetical protein